MFWPFYNAGSFHAPHESVFQKVAESVDQTEYRLRKALDMVLRDLGAAEMQTHHKKSFFAPI